MPRSERQARSPNALLWPSGPGHEIHLRTHGRGPAPGGHVPAAPAPPPAARPAGCDPRHERRGKPCAAPLSSPPAARPAALVASEGNPFPARRAARRPWRAEPRARRAGRACGGGEAKMHSIHTVSLIRSELWFSHGGPHAGAQRLCPTRNIRRFAHVRGLAPFSRQLKLSAPRNAPA